MENWCNSFRPNDATEQGRPPVPRARSSALLAQVLAGYGTIGGQTCAGKIRESNMMVQPQIDKLLVEITRRIGSASARVFSEAFAAATSDPEDNAFAVAVAWLLAQPHSARDRVDDIAVLLKLRAGT
jgi:hypothetical protein